MHSKQKTAYKILTSQKSFVNIVKYTSMCSYIFVPINIILIIIILKKGNQHTNMQIRQCFGCKWGISVNANEEMLAVLRNEGILILSLSISLTQPLRLQEIIVQLLTKETLKLWYNIDKYAFFRQIPGQIYKLICTENNSDRLNSLFVLI